MTSLDNIKVSSIRKYLYEYALLTLSASVVYLFIYIGKLNEYIRTDMMQQNINTTRAIFENTTATKELTEYIKRPK